MAEDALVEIRVDPDLRERAASVLERLGLSVADAVALLLARTARDGALPFPVDEQHDDWFRRQVEEALDDPRAPLAAEEARALFAASRGALLARIDDA